MARIVIYDTTTGYVKQYLKSANTPDYDKRSDILVNPAIPQGQPSDWIYRDSVLREMTVQEKSARDNTEETKAKTDARQLASGTIDAKNSEGAVIRALALIMLDEINVLRQKASLPLRTKSQLMTAIKNKLSSGDAD